MQTTRDAALCHHAITCCCLELNDALGAVRSGEQALSLARASGDRDLEGLVLIYLALGYGRLRRYAEESRMLHRYLDLVDFMKDSRQYAPEVYQALGQNCLRREDYPEAVRHLEAAMTLAVQAGDDRCAESSRRLLRSATIRAGRLDEAAKLFAESRAFLKRHPEDQITRFWYWHDRSDWAIAGQRQQRAQKAAWQAVNAAAGDLALEFEGYMLHHRLALIAGDPAQAMRFACEARVSALHGGRYDLAYEAVDAMINLNQAHGTSVMKGLAGHYARRGMNLFKYVPEHLFRPL
ncbi:MAG TPA: hypothetical protein VGK74_05565 [Symbiobacteriaceae bacterium]